MNLKNFKFYKFKSQDYLYFNLNASMLFSRCHFLFYQEVYIDMAMQLNINKSIINFTSHYINRFFLFIIFKYNNAFRNNF